MIFQRPLRKAKHEEGKCILKLADFNVQYGVEWFDNLDADVSELVFELEDGTRITQRETYSLHKKSNFAILIKSITGEYPDPRKDFDSDLILNKEFQGDLVHIKSSKGDVYEKIKNFSTIDKSLLEGRM